MAYTGSEDPNLPDHVKAMPSPMRSEWVRLYNERAAAGGSDAECIAAADAQMAKPMMKMCASFAIASTARIVQRRNNGSIVVEMPICAAATIDLSRTAGKGAGTASITVDDLRQMAANIAEWPGPIPINIAPHRPFEATHGAAPGFIESAEVRGDQLWARCTLTGELAREFESGMWRGFSVDIAKNPALPSKTLTGWAVWGGVLTNRPAAPVHFAVDNAIAASCSDLCVVQLELSGPGDNPSNGGVMPNEKAPELVALEAELKVKNEAFAALTARIDSLESAAAKRADREAQLEADLATAKSTANQRASAIDAAEKKAQAAKDEAASLSKRLEEKENESLSLEVRKIVRKAIDKGVAPSYFDGVDNDPVAWLKEKKMSLEALVGFCEALPVIQSRPISSGRPSASADEDLEMATLSPERVANLRAFGFDPKYATVTSSEQLRQLKK